MTAVLLTIDTEPSPAAHQRGVSPAGNIATAILGRVSDGEWGVAYQVGRLNAHGLKAVFFVEALCASVLGVDMLKRVIEPILSGGHEVQLHIHPEWVGWFPSDPVGGRRGQSIADFSYDDQIRLLVAGIETLTSAGAPRPIAFRAGNYGANNDTLRALTSLGVRYDTSYNLPYLSGPCRIVTDKPLLDPVLLDGVIEVPIAFFEDHSGHHRPAQICANSISELRLVIEQSVAQQRRTAVIVSHSFELLNRARTRANRLHVRRFEYLCELLGAMKTNAPTTGFVALDPKVLTKPSATVQPLRSHAGRTAYRIAEQALGTILYDRG